MNKKFRPIKGIRWWYAEEDDVIGLDESHQEEIKQLLIGRRVEKVDAEHLLLDDGTVIKVIGNGGCGGCPSGNYDLSVLNGADNAITAVEFDYAPHSDADVDIDDEAGSGYYRIFVYAENQKINLMQFDGTDGNGYYGTGFEILVRRPST